MTTPELILKDGRRLAYNFYGNLDDTPLLFFHGTPGTNLLAQMAEEGARKYGFCLIAPDRPGLGGSGFQPRRKLYHFAEDILELLDFLNLKECGIVAISGGAPYAFQCAHDLPERIPFVASLSGWISYGRPEARVVRISRPFRFFDWCARRFKTAFCLIGPVMLRMIRRSPEKVMAHLIADLPPADQEILREERYRSIVQQDLQNAFAQGWRGPAQEGELQFSVPRFSLQAVKQPVLLLHGTEDNIAPYAFAEVLRDNLPQVVDFRSVEGGGHFCAIAEQDWIFSSVRGLLSKR